MQKSYEKIIKNKQLKNSLFKYTTMIFAWLVVLILIGVVIFIFVGSIDGWKEYGLSIFSDSFKLSGENKSASIWLPLSITIIVTTISILIALPIGVKTAIFLHFRVKEKIAKILLIIINILAAIPSVVFGLFAINSLGPLLSILLDVSASFSILNASIMLSFMILPTIILLSYNGIKSVPVEIFHSGLALGLTKTRTIYKVILKRAKNIIIVATIVAIGRAIGETMALNFILVSQNYNTVFSSNSNIFMSSLKTLGSIIASNYFGENATMEIRSVLNVFGILLLIFVMLLNFFVFVFSNPKLLSKYSFLKKINSFISNVILFIPNQISHCLEYIIYKHEHKLEKNNTDQVHKFISERFKRSYFQKVYIYRKVFFEMLSFSLAIGFISWILISVFFNGINALSLPTQTITSFDLDSTGRAIFNTLIIVFLGIFLALPFALGVSIYLTEYNQNEKLKKTIMFFVDSLASTPSILFGIFGTTFFLQTLGLAAGGPNSNSILAGVLTIVIVIIPTLVRTIEQSLSNVNPDIRQNAYALGISRFETIFKLILPAAMQGLITSVILAMGRIMSETAPLFLTAGLTSSNRVNILLPGQTLTTRIFAQLFNPSSSAQGIMYEASFIAIILILVLVLFSQLLIPYFSNPKNRLKVKKLFLKKQKGNHEIKSVKK
ncbi:phosphate transport system permease protein [Mycoplasma testudineum]|uniref:Phosphate transport system permease protein PstA n=1 Tax=Mycoplasma testudineum TaxID=244584 RepID=A0A4R6IC46_9MOLU|nr:phosphate ABC transporter permease PstA [Mycoplasma testudineum]OYD26681.1 phosphate ABC transporter, permease protein PstA [Mycoplasma testudineum]TDO19810.1 phosphate transport system permease protein [Mycoplasma testudineum]